MPKKFRGPKGTKVRLRFLREGDIKSDFVVTLIRDRIILEDRKASIHYIEKEMNGQKKLVGLVNLPGFYLDRRQGISSAKVLKEIFKEVKDKKVDGVILDLSQNGGGLLSEAVKVAGLFFKEGNVVKTTILRERNGDEFSVVCR